MIKKLVCFSLLLIISGILIFCLCSYIGDDENVIVINKQHKETETRIDFNPSTSDEYEKETEDYD